MLITAIVASGPPGQRDEAAQDDAVADLVLRTADDDDGSIGHEVEAASGTGSRRGYRASRPSRAAEHVRPGWAGVRECPWDDGLVATSGAAAGPGHGPWPRAGPGGPVGRHRPRDAAPRRGLPAGAPARGLAPAGSAPDRRDPPPEPDLRADPVRADRPRRGRRRRRPSLLGRRPDLAQRRRPVPPDRAVPAVRLRALDAAAVRAVGAPAVGRRLVRLAGRDDPAPALDDPLGVPTAGR